MRGSLVVRNIGELASPHGTKALRGPEMNRLAIQRDAALVIEDGLFTYCGPENSLAFAEAARHAAGRLDATQPAVQELDAGGRAVVPGFVDSHTHFVFGGFRADEFFWRAEGLPYMELHNRGGGIRKTVAATRASSLEELIAAGRARLETMLSLGITTVEGKSGYGLDRDTELRQLSAMKALNETSPVDIVSTYMGAHSIPPEFPGDPDGYIDKVIAEYLPEVAASGLAEFADIFCEKGVFGIETSRRYLAAAAGLGLKLKLHADEIVALGGAGLAAELGAVSADHLLKATPADLAAMAARGVVATCLPLTAFSLREPYADARFMIDTGGAVALASDLNPGSCYSQSVPLMFAIAVLQMRLTMAEALTALTLNGAAAVNRAERVGSIEIGKNGDFLILDAPSHAHLAYHTGMNIVRTTVKSGRVVYTKK